MTSIFYKGYCPVCERERLVTQHNHILAPIPMCQWCINNHRKQIAAIHSAKTPEEAAIKSLEIIDRSVRERYPHKPPTKAAMYRHQTTMHNMLEGLITKKKRPTR